MATLSVRLAAVLATSARFGTAAPLYMPTVLQAVTMSTMAHLAIETHSQGPKPTSPALSVPVAIVLGLVASFIQSLGIALQRGSHLQNDALPPAQRRVELRRPRWLIGFAIFMIGTVSTVLQIGALPIVILAPLGAVSLLYNAVLARFLLNTTFSRFMVAGTALITVGAVLIALFGAITESPHSLDELLRLFVRPPFVACATVIFFVLFCVLFIAHLAEWQLQIRIFRINLGPDYWKKRSGSGGGKMKKKKSSRGMRRRWSAPTLAPLAEVNENASGIATPAIAIADEAARRTGGGLSTYAAGNSSPCDRRPRHSDAGGRRRTGEQKSYGAVGSSTLAPPLPPPRQSSIVGTLSASEAGPASNGSASNGDASKGQVTANGESGRSDASSPLVASTSDSSLGSTSSSTSRTSTDDAAVSTLADADPGIRRTKTLLAVAYAGASGTLSGACLLLAKSGIELVLTSLTGGSNQFGRWQSWALVGVMLGAAVLQLWYLNKALRFESPVLVMPLAFCFYNTSSIALGLVYFDQLGALAWWNICLVVLGTLILLMGVWVVSLHTEDEVEAELEEETQMQQHALVLDAVGPVPLSHDGGDEPEMDERQPLLAPPTTPRRVSEQPQLVVGVVPPPRLSSSSGQDGSAVSSVVGVPRDRRRPARRRAQSLASDSTAAGQDAAGGSLRVATGALGVGGGGLSGLVSPLASRLHFARRLPSSHHPPPRRSVHFLSRSASLSLGLGFAPAMQDSDDDDLEDDQDVERGLDGEGRSGAVGGVAAASAAAGTGASGAVGGAQPVDTSPLPPPSGHGHGREGSAGSTRSSTAIGGATPQLSYTSFLKRGLSIGIGVGSPGFFVQPTGFRSASSSSSSAAAASASGAAAPVGLDASEEGQGGDASDGHMSSLLANFGRFRLGRRPSRPCAAERMHRGESPSDASSRSGSAPSGGGGDLTGRGGGRRTGRRLRPGRSASETDVADAYLEETVSPTTAAAAAAEQRLGVAVEEGEEEEHLVDGEAAEGAGDSGVTVGWQATTSAAASSSTVLAVPSSGWATELDTEALASRLGELTGWARIRRLLGVGTG